MGFFDNEVTLSNGQAISLDAVGSTYKLPDDYDQGKVALQGEKDKRQAEDAAMRESATRVTLGAALASRILGEQSPSVAPVITPTQIDTMLNQEASARATIDNLIQDNRARFADTKVSNFAVDPDFRKRAEAAMAAKEKETTTGGNSTSNSTTEKGLTTNEAMAEVWEAQDMYQAIQRQRYTLPNGDNIFRGLMDARKDEQEKLDILSAKRAESPIIAAMFGDTFWMKEAYDAEGAVTKATSLQAQVQEIQAAHGNVMELLDNYETNVLHNYAVSSRDPSSTKAKIDSDNLYTRALITGVENGTIPLNVRPEDMPALGQQLGDYFATGGEAYKEVFTPYLPAIKDVINKVTQLDVVSKSLDPVGTITDLIYGDKASPGTPLHDKAVVMYSTYENAYKASLVAGKSKATADLELSKFDALQPQEKNAKVREYGMQVAASARQNGLSTLQANGLIKVMPTIEDGLIRAQQKGVVKPASDYLLNILRTSNFNTGSITTSYTNVINTAKKTIEGLKPEDKKAAIATLADELSMAFAVHKNAIVEANRPWADLSNYGLRISLDRIEGLGLKEGQGGQVVDITSRAMLTQILSKGTLGKN